ncbi:hypothetical protein PpBr36_08328 [Pyricularia pennisetigena]|uniref:hypothetical protein n=1 Tax=Pyricularia pennisetigena TaxID=1578925 RepID=UPI00114E1065|nr:hypothetical protein PpBr36_08328 [Pyricularia pennisetigena]TLS24062.1 hypothetical protein PpBr36_08328 [Pyricularia pennisetigena]
MGTIATIAAVVLGISFMTFVAFFGRLPMFRHTPVSWLHRLLWVYIPRGVLALDQKLTSGKFGSSLVRFGRFMMNDRHPTVMIFFFLIMAVSESAAVPKAWSQLTTLQQITLAISIFLPYYTLYKAAYTDPGYITGDNHRAHMAAYPYDFTIFHPGSSCRTCGLLKPPRSKHCSICKHCIGRMDHHCIFINSCVGAGNAHWFLLLLLSTAVLSLYGGVLCLSLIVRSIRRRAPGFEVLWWRGNFGDGMDLNSYFVLWSWGIADQVQLGAVGLLAILCSPLVWGLFGYNMWNVWGGVTTNESLKWSDLSEDMADGIAFKRRIAPGRLKDLRFEPAYTSWPVEAEQIIIRTNDGQPPPVEGAGLEGDGDWERVWKLKNVENLYDLGFWDNLADIFSPTKTSNDLYMEIPHAEDPGPRRGRRRVRD